MRDLSKVKMFRNVNLTCFTYFQINISGKWKKKLFGDQETLSLISFIFVSFEFSTFRGQQMYQKNTPFESYTI